MKECIHLFQEELNEKLRVKLVPRSYETPDLLNKATALIGIRRSGKSSILLQKIQELLVCGIKTENILFANFEDDRIESMTYQELGKFIDLFCDLNLSKQSKITYLFLDEIQNIDGWELPLRRFLDTKNIKIYITGSSAKLLSKEIATSMRGRAFACEVWPYSFKEFLLANNHELPGKKPTRKEKILFQKKIREYLITGGFPETTGLNPGERRKLLQDYIEVLVFRDIVERHHITNISLIRYLIRTLIQNTGRLFAVNKFYNDAKSQGFQLSKNTVYDYLSYVEDCYLAFAIPIFTESMRQQNSNPRKIFISDTGLVEAFSFKKNRSEGSLFENLIYLDLRRNNHTVYYYKTSKDQEIDFVTRSLDGKMHLYQVALNTDDPETYEREMQGLKTAEKELGIRGKLITLENYLESGLV